MSAGRWSDGRPGHGSSIRPAARPNTVVPNGATADRADLGAPSLHGKR